MMIEVILQVEMENHLGYSKYDYSNKNTENSRNGYNEKTLRGKKGSFRIRVPRDRKSEFEPKIVKKWKKDISEVEDMIIPFSQKISKRFLLIIQVLSFSSLCLLFYL